MEEMQNAGGVQPRKIGGARWALLIIIIIIIGALFVYQGRGRSDLAPADEDVATDTPEVTGEESTDATDTEAVAGVTIRYTDGGFEPAEVRVPVGTTVTWVNESSSGMWPASAMHPTHAVYPGSGIEKCGTAEAAGIFDSCADIETWSFTFGETGEWAFHNHSRVAHFGKVIVE